MALAVALGVAAYAFFDPTIAGWPLRCPWHQLTGTLCPGCGSQRAIHALLHGHIAEAWGYNAALLPGVALVFLLILPVKSGPVSRLRTSRWVAPIVLVATLVWWVGRNVI